MKINLSFFGAAQNVTGSKYLLEANGKKLLIDCGMYQEHHLKDRNWEQCPIPADQIDAVLLTHAHLDHCGLLPRLVKEGFNGPVYSTEPTLEIARIVLLDCAKINEVISLFLTFTSITLAPPETFLVSGFTSASFSESISHLVPVIALMRPFSSRSKLMRYLPHCFSPRLVQVYR